MPCYHPLAACPMPGRTRLGKNNIKVLGKASTFSKQAKLILDCGQCIGCRLEKSRVWAVRLEHEKKFHEESAFLTLTYDEQSVPLNGSLIKSDLRTFFNDLRGRLSYYGEKKIKFFAVGEYGEKSLRPHYHAIIFGQSFKRPISDYLSTPEETSRSGGDQYSHGIVSAVWPKGMHRISEVTFESCAYVARYSLKKITGASAIAHYGDRIPEFLSSSNGLSKAWFEKWKDDVYPADQVVLPGRPPMSPPRYYDYLLEKMDPELYQKIKVARAARDPVSPEEYRKNLYEKHISGEVKTRLTKEALNREL